MSPAIGYGAFGRTEALRRLRRIAEDARRATGARPNWRVEVGLRCRPLAVASLDGATTLYPSDDDLADYRDLPAAAANPDVARHGALVHLYLSTTGAWGELQDVVVGWMGTPSRPPALVDVNGHRVPIEEDVR